LTGGAASSGGAPSVGTVSVIGPSDMIVLPAAQIP
jgi:hypothetical protein